MEKLLALINGFMGIFRKIIELFGDEVKIEASFAKDTSENYPLFQNA